MKMFSWTCPWCAACWHLLAVSVHTHAVLQVVHPFGSPTTVKSIHEALRVYLVAEKLHGSNQVRVLLCLDAHR